MTKKTAKQKKLVDPISTLDRSLVTDLYRMMVKSRELEERLIRLYRTGDSYFWIGAPGEEAFGVPLGLLAHRGQGPEYDYFHLHYRATPTMVALGMPMLDSIRLMMNRATDPCTGGRNFSNHYCFPQWNVTPVSSPIEVQYSFAIGTAHVQKREKTNGITIVTGGDAGTAEGDFASALIWSSRRGSELPMLMTVQNNKWGISTSFDQQHGEDFIADRGKAFNMRTAVMNGNDPIESYIVLQEAMDYVRKERKPFLLECMVSRLNGHSSASGANRVEGEECCIELFERRLLEHGYFSEKDFASIKKEYHDEAKAAAEVARTEPSPQADTIWDHFFVDGENGNWRKF